MTELTKTTIFLNFLTIIIMLVLIKNKLDNIKDRVEHLEKTIIDEYNKER